MRLRKSKYVLLKAVCLIFCIGIFYWKDSFFMSSVTAFTYRLFVNNYTFLKEYLRVTQEVAQKFFNHRYLINHKHKCKVQDLLLLLMVKTSPQNTDRRDAIRGTWGNETYARQELGVNMKVVFFLGVHPQESDRAQLQQQLAQEDKEYGDLVQQDFEDTFYNLTIKLLLQFHWTHSYCSHAKFVMSADDDVFIHMPNLVRYLQAMDQRHVRGLWTGHVHWGAPPIRKKDSKYYVPYEMYPWPSYPDYTAGAGYVVSGDVAAKIYQASLMLNATLYIDDVFMGICANVMGVSPKHHGYFSGGGKTSYHPCVYRKIMTSHGHVKDSRYLWNISTTPQFQNSSSGLLDNLYCKAVKIAQFCVLSHLYGESYPCKTAFW